MVSLCGTAADTARLFGINAREIYRLLSSAEHRQWWTAFRQQRSQMLKRARWRAYKDRQRASGFVRLKPGFVRIDRQTIAAPEALAQLVDIERGRTILEEHGLDYTRYAHLWMQAGCDAHLRDSAAGLQETQSLSLATGVKTKRRKSKKRRSATNTHQ